MDYENDAFIWENQSWANLSNDVPYISGGETVVVTTEDKEKEVKGKGKEKKRGRGGATITTTAKKGKKAESSNNNNGEKKKKKKKTTTTEEEEAKKASRHAMHIWTEKQRRKKMRNLYGELHKSLPQLPSKANKSIIVGEAVKSIKTLESTLQKLQKHKLEKLHGVEPSSNNNSPSLEPSVAATSTVALLSTRESFMADQVSSSVNNTTAAANTNNNNGVNNPTETTAAPQLPPVMIQTWTSSNVVLNVFGNDAQFAVYAPKKDGLFANICGAFEKHNLELISAHISSDAFRCVYTIQARVANGANDQFPENVTVEEIYKQAADDITLWVSSN